MRGWSPGPAESLQDWIQELASETHLPERGTRPVIGTLPELRDEGLYLGRRPHGSTFPVG